MHEIDITMFTCWLEDSMIIFVRDAVSVPMKRFEFCSCSFPGASNGSIAEVPLWVHRLPIVVVCVEAIQIFVHPNSMYGKPKLG